MFHVAFEVGPDVAFKFDAESGWVQVVATGYNALKAREAPA